MRLRAVRYCEAVPQHRTGPPNPVGPSETDTLYAVSGA
jgi:hypothetical protein